MGWHFTPLAALQPENVTYIPSESKWLQAGKNYFRIIFGGSTGKSCKSPGGYYIIKFLGNYFSHPVRAPFLRNLCSSGTETGGGGLLQDMGLLQEKMFGELFSGALHKNPVIAPGQLHKIIFTELFW